MRRKKLKPTLKSIYHSTKYQPKVILRRINPESYLQQQNLKLSKEAASTIPHGGKVLPLPPRRRISLGVIDLHSVHNAHVPSETACLTDSQNNEKEMAATLIDGQNLIMQPKIKSLIEKKGRMQARAMSSGNGHTHFDLQTGLNLSPRSSSCPPNTPGTETSKLKSYEEDGFLNSADDASSREGSPGVPSSPRLWPTPRIVSVSSMAVPDKEAKSRVRKQLVQPQKKPHSDEPQMSPPKGPLKRQNISAKLEKSSDRAETPVTKATPKSRRTSVASDKSSDKLQVGATKVPLKQQQTPVLSDKGSEKSRTSFTKGPSKQQHTPVASNKASDKLQTSSMKGPLKRQQTPVTSKKSSDGSQTSPTKGQLKKQHSSTTSVKGSDSPQPPPTNVTLKRQQTTATEDKGSGPPSKIMRVADKAEEVAPQADGPQPARLGFWDRARKMAGMRSSLLRLQAVTAQLCKRVAESDAKIREYEEKTLGTESASCDPRCVKLQNTLTDLNISAELFVKMVNILSESRPGTEFYNSKAAHIMKLIHEYKPSH